MAHTLEHFFTSKFFRIPNYQRDYSWNVNNVDDLIDDIIEAIETETSHYIGTFILSETKENLVYNVVDGQQRLTTLTMLFSIAIKELASKTNKIIYGNHFIQSNESGVWKLELLNENSDFLKSLLKGRKRKAKTNSQKLLVNAYERISTRIKELKSNGELKSKFLDMIKQLDVMEFVESDDGKAIRIFQTVNDRGQPLSNMDKAKSLLIYYSNRFLDGSLDDSINNSFGKIFHHFNKIRTIGKENKIDVISQKRFNEDSVMRYHFLSFANDKYDYRATANYVLNDYLKKTLKDKKRDKVTLSEFIKDYVTDLELFFSSFADVLNNVSKNSKYYKLFSVLGLSAFLYPLLIRLEMKGLLNQQLSSLKRKTFLDLIEIADFRVYKIRGTDPSKDVSFLARDSQEIEPDIIENRLKRFITDFMSDAEFNRRLSADIYPNVGLKHIFIEYNENLIKKKYSVKRLSEINALVPTIEHIFPREARFNFPNYSFESQEEYNDRIHRIGNLTLLERSINSQCSEKNPDQKISDKLYGKSTFEDPKRISAMIMNRGNSFDKDDIIKRKETLTNFCLKRWQL
ncbi:MAG: DUF262 domain-containing HNH endonuclease family protein [Nitrosopumilus sp.]